MRRHINVKNAIRATVAFATAAILVASAALYHYAPQNVNDRLLNLSGSIAKVTNMEENSGGTGFLVELPSGKQGIITNVHVCQAFGRSGKAVAAFTDGIKYLVTKQAEYPLHDLCLLNIARTGRPGLTVAKYYPRRGQLVYVLGYPALENLSLTNGNYNGDMVITMAWEDDKCVGIGYRKVEIDPFFQMLFRRQFICLRDFNVNVTSAPIIPGNSGSPLLDSDGSVLAVVFAADEFRRSFAIPLTYLQDFLKDK